MLLKSITRSLFFGSVFLSLLNLPVIAQVPTISYPNGTNLRHYYIGTAISSETPTVGGGGFPSQTYVHSIVEEFYSTRNSATLPLTVPHPNTVFPLDYGQFAFASQNSQVYSIDWTLQSAVGTAVNGSLNTIFGFIRMSVLGTPKYVYSYPTTHRIYLSGVGVVGGNPTQVVSGTNNGSAAAGDYALFNSPMAIVPVPNLANKIYVADKGNNKIRILDLTTSTASDFTITGVTLNAPVGLAVDSGSNLWVTDSHRLIKITPQGQATVMAGNGTAGDVDGNASVSRLNTPYGISIDGSDDVYFADRMNHKIKVYHPANGILSTMAGSTQGNQLGLNGAAKFDEPSAVWVSGDGTLMHVADYNNNKIKSIRMTKAFGISPALPPG